MSKRLIVLITAVSVVLGLITLSVAVFLTTGSGPAAIVMKDSGIKACEMMAENSTKPKPSEEAEAEAKKKMTKDEYEKLRKMFADSKHDDIRTPGVKMVDYFWAISQLPEGKELGALAYIGPLTSSIQDLRTGCKNHGVDVPFGLDSK